MTTNRVPNRRLRELLAEARWTGPDLARAVNRAGAESGLRDLAYQRASVHQWLTGTVPRWPVAQLVCAVLGRRLGRVVTLADAGFDGAAAQHPPADPGDLLAGLAAAALDQDRGHRRGAGLRVYQPYGETDFAPTAAPTAEPDLAPAADPGFEPPGDPARVVETAVRDGGGRDPVGPEVLTLLLPVFSAVDRLKGGGHARTALAAFLATPVAATLSAPAPPVRRAAIQSAACRLSYLCAFMHLDDELNGLAGHYYRFGLGLARQAGDTAAEAMVLRAMAVQAHELGHPEESLRLARAAADLRISPADLRLRAAVLGQLALAEAATGDRTSALRHIREAYDLLPGITGPPPPVGDYHRASWDHQHALVRAELGDHAGAVRALETSAARRPCGEARSRALLLGKLAERQLAAGRVEAACETWHQFLDLYPSLSSRRVHSAALRLRRLLLPFRRRPAADQLLQRAAALRGW